MGLLNRTAEWTGSEQYIEDSIEQSRAFIERQYERVLNGTQRSFRSIGGTHGSISRCFWTLCDPANAIEHHRISVWYRHWWMRLQLMAAGEQVELPLIGADQLVVMNARDRYARVKPSDLTEGLLVGDESYIQLLLDWDQPPPEPEKPVWKPERQQLWRSFFADREDLNERLVALQLELDVAPDGNRSSSGQIWKDQYWAEWRLMRAIADRSQADFDAAIVAAHEHHVAYYLSENPDTGELRNAQAGVLTNRPFSVIVNHGVNRGLDLNYRSPYFIDWVPLAQGLEPVAPGYEP